MLDYFSWTYITMQIFMCAISSPPFGNYADIYVCCYLYFLVGVKLWFLSPIWHFSLLIFLNCVILIQNF